MAYITSETVKKIRQALKAEFPNIKFSVRKEHHSSVHVAIMKSSLFDDGVDMSINQYWIDSASDLNGEQKTMLKKVDEIIRVAGDHFDKSDSMTDYFHCAFYYGISVGKWDKAHEKV